MNTVSELFSWYREHQDELVQKYNGAVLVIHDRQVLGVYDTEREAYLMASRELPPGSFLIQRCSPGDSDYSGAYHSRVAFG